MFSILAQWVAEQLSRSGLTLPQWQAKGFKLSTIGINKRSAVAELKPRIPLDHEWYNAHGDSRNRYWKVLFNRMFYFFHRHNDAGQGPLVPAVAEWPGTVSEDGLSLVPPAVPQATADEPEDPMPAVPGTGYPEDDMPAAPPGAGYPEDASGHPDPCDTLAPTSRLVSACRKPHRG